jgi:aspartate/methionine/tyrosine aminotransferase
MDNLILASNKCPPGFIDCAIGEPHVVRDNLLNSFNLDDKILDSLSAEDLIYPAPAGYGPLVKYLEDKYHYPVVITNGAKQALGACFYAWKKMGWSQYTMKKPFWALIPPLSSIHNMECSFYANQGKLPFLLLDPNNPNGDSVKVEELINLEKKYSVFHVPLVHDAAYYNHIYLPTEHPLPVIGDAQIYSVSKMLGLSGLRLGYVVCKNKLMHSYITEYMEAMTVGVSILSQKFYFQILAKHLDLYPQTTLNFERTSAADILHNKKLCKEINPNILLVPEDIEQQFGMFGFFKCHNVLAFEQAKIKIIQGAPFGAPGFIRMNLAIPRSLMQEVVTRLNNT